MKKISVNKNDCSFKNKYKFDDLVSKIKAIGGSIKANAGRICITGIMIGALIISGLVSYNLGSDIVEDIKYEKEYEIYIENEGGEVIEYEILPTDTIFVNIFADSEQQTYLFKDNLLYDNNGNIIDLTGYTGPIYFWGCNIDETTFKNINLSISEVKRLNLYYSSVTDECICYFPLTLENLSLNNCNYITNLDMLVERCPNITKLSINNLSSLNNINFIYRMKNLKEINISNCAYITQELLDYLKDKNIKNNLTETDVINSKKTDEIINEIIKPNMTDKEKIQAICLYVIENYEFDIKTGHDSNKNPLNCFLKNGKGVCISYAYITNVLLNKVGIKSFKVENSDHAWNVVEVDGEYFYIDTTNIDSDEFYHFLLKYFNFTNYYMTDTENTFEAATTKPSDEETMMPMCLVEKIEAERVHKSFIEKNNGDIENSFIIVGILLKILSIPATIFLGAFSYTSTKELCKSLKRGYEKRQRNK